MPVRMSVKGKLGAEFGQTDFRTMIEVKSDDVRTIVGIMEIPWHRIRCLRPALRSRFIPVAVRMSVARPTCERALGRSQCPDQDRSSLRVDLRVLY
mmetsp:Transcript_36045/g.57626  ORF Transcript_36045/g.57626 Transcript_36045/m.57626 type:complete len:96 (+) Transcript_36045:230-517(+)